MQLNKPKIHIQHNKLPKKKCYKMEGEINCYIHDHDLTEVGCKQCVGVFIYIIVVGECSSASALFKRSGQIQDSASAAFLQADGPASASLYEITLPRWRGAVTLTLP